MSAEKIHFVGIGGVGMAALAALEKMAGNSVSGCDVAASPRTRWLEGLGVAVAIGHSPTHVGDCDFAVVTPAVAGDNPELQAAKRIVYRGERLARHVNACDSVAVCGSHGKTTTSTFVARLLIALGERVRWAIGGETGDFPVAGDSGGDREPVLVVEADESDGTLALYRPQLLVVTNCEYDHPSHFPTPADYFACFDAARRGAREVVESETLPALDFLSAIGCYRELAQHNRRNARAAVEVALRRGHDPGRIAAALPQVVARLPDRRFQVIWPSNGVGGALVVTDYAHHPTELKCAVEMARERCREGRLRVLFQPHRHSRTKAFLADFPKAFAAADETVLCPVYTAFESPVEGGTSYDLYAACRASGLAVRLAVSCAEAWRHARLEMKEGDVTLLLGAGSIVELVPQVLRDCADPAFGHPSARRVELAGFSFFRTGGVSVGGGERIYCGMGSNTWISDLTTDAEYVRGDLPADRAGASLGIPWMAGVPGTIGGWVKMNAGAFGHSVSELVRRVRVDGEWIAADACGFGYRSSAITGRIEAVEFDFAALDRSVAATEFLSRRRRFPPRCCGSVFKNPPGDFAGRLLDSCGCRGMRVGGASVWSEHANVIFAEEGANSSDILALAGMMRELVMIRFGVVLEPEISGLRLE